LQDGPGRLLEGGVRELLRVARRLRRQAHRQIGAQLLERISKTQRVAAADFSRRNGFLKNPRNNGDSRTFWASALAGCRITIVFLKRALILIGPGCSGAGGKGKRL
jgi:hypothetical protein